MAKYLLKISGSNNIVNTIEWDGTGSLTPPTGYVFEASISGSSSSINYLPTSSDDHMPSFYGNLSGVFSGDLIGSVRLNGKEIDTIFNETKFGELRFVGSDNPSIISQSKGFYFSENNLKLSVSNLEYDKECNYTSVFDKIINEQISNYKLTLKYKPKPSINIQYIVTNTELTSSGTSSYYNISAVSINSSSVSILDPFSGSFYVNQEYYGSNWYVDFDLGNDAIVGRVYGSFTGSLNGTASHALNFTGVATSALTAISSSYATFAETASKLEVFTTSSNWTKPSWAKTVKVVCVGGGGGGGGSFGVPSGQVSGGGGGACESVSMGEFDANLLPTSSISITVGAGGTGGAGQYSGGSTGGSSMFDTLLIAYGGEGGEAGTDMGGSLAYVRGGRSGGTINYLNTGGGPGGRGSVGANGITALYNTIHMTVAPSLPLNEVYVDLDWNFEGYPGERMGIPAAIAPTGGGGGLGYDADNGGNQDGDTDGGSIKTNAALLAGLQDFSKGLVGKTYTYSVDGYVPAFYTKIGLGGNGGNPSSSLAPSGGSRYGGGGGGAYGFYSGSYGSVSSGARGADGVVIIISEA